MKQAYLQYQRVMNKGKKKAKKNRFEPRTSSKPTDAVAMGSEKMRRRSITLESKFKARPSPRDLQNSGKDLKIAGQRLQDLMKQRADVQNQKHMNSPENTLNKSINDFIHRIQGLTDVKSQQRALLIDQARSIEVRHTLILEKVKESYEERLNENYRIC